MIINAKTTEKLRDLINEETEYRSGPKLVAFFNNLGFRDSYGQGFPSRWKYTQERLEKINGKPELDKCIKILFHPSNFIGKISELDRHILDFNQYLSFDKWEVIRNEAEISFRKVEKVKLHDDRIELIEDHFLEREFHDISIEELGLESIILETLIARIEEIKSCFKAEAHLAVIFLAGSTLEGILLGIATKRPKAFNQAKAAPIDKEGKIKKFPNWTLSNLIDVSNEIKLIGDDVKKFSHALREFRNYIHPYQQVTSGFTPDNHTAKICF